MPNGVHPRKEPRVKVCGVYAIRAPSGSQYIGSSYDIFQRTRCHRNQAMAGRHGNEPLIRAFAKYGDQMQVAILIVCRPEDRIMYEQCCLDALKPEYNCSKIAAYPQQTEQSRAKLSAANKAHYKAHPERARRHSEIMKTKLSNRKGVKVSEATRKKQSMARHAWLLEHPEERVRAAERAKGNLHNVGKKRTPESRARMRASRLAFLERKASAECTSTEDQTQWPSLPSSASWHSSSSSWPWSSSQPGSWPGSSANSSRP